MTAYYNEIDHAAAEWLRVLIARGLIPAGTVDERSIVDVCAADLDGYDQCHFFAGIGGWPYALDIAGWRGPVWTGSCPCQPLSSAGQRKGHADERHLWPAFQRLIAECRPATVFGEQVAGKDGREWLAGVRADLETLGYAVGAADLCAAGVGAPHIRQRLYWLAHADGGNASTKGLQRGGEHRQQPQDGRRAQGLADAGSIGRQRRQSSPSRHNDHRQASGRPQGEHGPVGAIADSAARVGDTAGKGLQGQWSKYRPRGERHSGLVGLAVQVGVPEWNGPTIAIECSDGARRVSAQPDSFPVGHGVSGRVGRLRAYGNAIIPQVAAAFVAAFMEVAP